MAGEPKQAAAICDDCGTAIAIRIDPEEKIHSIDARKREICLCENPNLRIIGNMTDIPEDTDSNQPE